MSLRGEKSCWEKMGAPETCSSTKSEAGAGFLCLFPASNLSKVSSTSTWTDLWLGGSCEKTSKEGLPMQLVFLVSLLLDLEL